MVLRRARALFAVSLTFGLLQLLSLVVASATEPRADAARAWMPSLQKAHVAAHGVRTGLPEPDGHHAAPTPFAPSSPYRLGVPASGSPPVASFPQALDGTAPAATQLARAPPVLP